MKSFNILLNVIFLQQGKIIPRISFALLYLVILQVYFKKYVLRLDVKTDDNSMITLNVR